jgi:hypothetical protein
MGNYMNSVPMQPPSSPKKATVYDIHQQAVHDYHEACRQFQAASARREETKLALEKSTQNLAELVQAALNDPTVPQPINGMAGQQLGYANRP